MKHEEDGDQMALIAWAKTKRFETDRLIDYLFAIPNGAHLAGDGITRARKMSRMKMMGLKPGVSDLFLSIPIGNMHGMYIEMKKNRKSFPNNSALNNAVSESQKEWLERAKSKGYHAVACFGFDEAKKEIEMYLKGVVV